MVNTINEVIQCQFQSDSIQGLPRNTREYASSSNRGLMALRNLNRENGNWRVVSSSFLTRKHRQIIKELEVNEHGST